MIKNGWTQKYGKYVEENPQVDFNGTAFVFTGLGRHSSDAKNHKVVRSVVAKGGVYRSSVSSKTNYLIVNPKDAGASKIDAVIALRRQGVDIKVILLSDLEQILLRKDVEKSEPLVEQKPELNTSDKIYEHPIQYSEITVEELSEKKVFIHCDKGLHTAVGGCLTWCNAQICDGPGSALYICTDAASISGQTASGQKILNRIAKAEEKKNAPKFIRFDALAEATQKAYEKMANAETDEDRLARAKRLFTKNVILLSYIMNQNEYESPTPEGIFPAVESSEVADRFLQWAMHEFKFPTGLDGFDSAAGSSPQFAFRNLIARYVANFVFYGISTKETFLRDKWEGRGDYRSDKKVCFSLDSFYFPEGLVYLNSSRWGESLVPKQLMDKANLWVPHDVKSFCGAGNKKNEHEKTSTDPGVKERTVAEWKKIFSFKSENGTITITKYKGTDSVVYIPEKIGKSTVATIGSGAFRDQVFLTEIIIPDTVTKIENAAFDNCTSLEKVNIPEKVRTVDWNVFRECISLKEVVIPNSVNEISDCLFLNCRSLTKVVLPKNVTSIGENAFTNCSSLTEITLPDGVETLRRATFANCSALAKIGIPKSIRNVELYVFLGCDSLKLNEYQNGCYIGNEYNPYQVLIRPVSNTISEIDIHKDCEVLAEGVFAECSSLKRVTISGRIKVIPSEAFQGCQSLESVVLPDTVETIRGGWWRDTGAFVDCTSLTKIVIPESVTDFDSDAIFKGCNKDLTIYGKAGSPANQYAIRNNIRFEEI